ncbi:MAG: hypothetical protein N5P05_003159 [Chroococcopsis gigantea SAG 12.99]|jgi:predicted RNA-binding protein YlqC (UPF0109 family)|nr:KH domain-containing protein [Chlorogloea purpurea SAG 13.99]MDV3001553.1 hypothetical protein [Chroococcopsis gigantea SAG 12.99]
MPDLASLSTGPDYPGLLKFLVKPFLEFPDSLCIDCEKCKNDQRVWIRVAFEAEDKGKVYGRGGRNLQAIRTVLETTATNCGQSVHLNVYEPEGEEEGGAPKRRPGNGSNGSDRKYQPKRGPRSSRPLTPRPG